MANQEYDPRVIRILIEESASSADLKTNSTDLIKLSNVVSAALGIEEGQPGYIAEKYLDSLYRDSGKAINKSENLRKNSQFIDTLLQYVGAQSFDEYKESKAENLIGLSELTENDYSVIPDGRPGKPFDMYDLMARLLPSLIGLVPLIILLMFTIYTSLFENKIGSMTLVGIVSFIMVGFSFSVLAFSNLVAGLSKIYQNKYFMKKDGFPTTYLLLYDDTTYSDEYKKCYRDKVAELFNLKSLPYEEEQEGKTKSIQWLNSAAEYVKHYVFKGLIRTQNIRYGFTRNLIGATFFGIPFSIIGGITGLLINSIGLALTSLFLLIMYSIIQIFKKHLLIESAEAYGKELIANFMK